MLSNSLPLRHILTKIDVAESVAFTEAIGCGAFSHGQDEQASCPCEGLPKLPRNNLLTTESKDVEPFSPPCWKVGQHSYLLSTHPASTQRSSQTDDSGSQLSLQRV